MNRNAERLANSLILKNIEGMWPLIEEADIHGFFLDYRKDLNLSLNQTIDELTALVTYLIKIEINLQEFKKQFKTLMLLPQYGDDFELIFLQKHIQESLDNMFEKNRCAIIKVEITLKELEIGAMSNGVDLETLDKIRKILERVQKLSLTPNNSERAIEPLIALLKDKDWSVRVKAAWALGEIGDKKALPFLEEYLDEQYPLEVEKTDVLYKTIVHAMGKIKGLYKNKQR